MFKNYVIVGLTCLIAAMIIGVQPVQRAINEAFYRGTLTGVDKCISYSDTQLISSEAMRAACVSLFQRSLFSDEHAKGRAGPGYTEEGVIWVGNLENNTPDHVTTWIRLAVTIYDAKGIEEKFMGDTSVWVDPLGDSDFRVDLPDLTRDMVDATEFCERDAPSPMSCMRWGIVEVKGLSI